MRAMILVMLCAGCARLFGLDPPHVAEDDAQVPDVPPPCASNTDCPDQAAPLCDIAIGMCVECVASTDCTATAPICDPGTHTCVTCELHSDCPTSHVCRPDGTCADANSIVYVDGATGADVGTCTLAAPCLTITYAMSQAAGRTTIKLAGTINDCVSIGGSVWTWLADPGTKLTPTCTSSTVNLSGGVDLVIYDLEIDGQVNASAVFSSSSTLRVYRSRVANAGTVGFDVRGGTLVISRTTVIGNTGGGILTDGSATFDIENSFIVRNGTTTSHGGVFLGAMSAGNNRFEFNTVVDNQGKGDTDPRTAGVGCQSSTLDVPNNLIARNNSASGIDNTSASGCTFSRSLVQVDTSALAFGNDATAPYDYHIGASSIARDNAYPSSISIDVDGQHRPSGVANDFGADEHLP